MHKRINYRLINLKNTLFERIRVRLKNMPAAKKANHNLEASLIVNLTSYNRRLAIVDRTIKSLLLQSLVPDKIILWLTEDDYNRIPQKLENLKQYGLEIQICEDLRSFKKIVPAVRLYKNSYHVVFDDDIIYPSNCISDLIKSYQKIRSPITSRAHLVVKAENGQISPYENWIWEGGNSFLDPCNFATTGSGTLFPPNSFHEDVCRTDIFQSLAPTCDDVWLYWMIRMNKKCYYKIKARTLTPSQFLSDTGLCLKNVRGGGNDISIRKMYDRYGDPTKNN